MPLRKAAELVVLASIFGSGSAALAPDVFVALSTVYEYVPRPTGVSDTPGAPAANSAV